jgi:hypothetical protein
MVLVTSTYLVPLLVAMQVSAFLIAFHFLVLIVQKENILIVSAVIESLFCIHIWRAGQVHNKLPLKSDSLHLNRTDAPRPCRLAPWLPRHVSAGGRFAALALRHRRDVHGADWALHHGAGHRLAHAGGAGGCVTSARGVVFYF